MSKIFKKKFQYQQEYKKLKKMGYKNKEFNRSKLLEHNGDINKVIADYNKSMQNLNSTMQHMMQTAADTMPVSPHYRTKNTDYYSTDSVHSNDNEIVFYPNDPNDKDDSSSPTPPMISNMMGAPPSSSPVLSPVMNNNNNNNDSFPKKQQRSKPKPQKPQKLHKLQKPKRRPSQASALIQSSTPMSYTPEITSAALEQMNNNEEKFEEKKSDHLLTHMSQSLRHERVHALSITSRDLFAEDTENYDSLSDNDLREMIHDVLDDHKPAIESLAQLIRAMNIYKMETKIRVSSMYPEILTLRGETFDINKHDLKDLNGLNGLNHNQHQSYEFSINNNDGLETEIDSDSNSDANSGNGNDNDDNDSNSNSEEKSTEEWIETTEYCDLLEFAKQEMIVNLQLNSKSNSKEKEKIVFKSKELLSSECSNSECFTFSECPCFLRMKSMISVYSRFQKSKLWRRVPIGPIISCYPKCYGYQQLFDDFQHFQHFHVLVDRIGFTKLCNSLENEYSCDLKNCLIFQRHYRNRALKSESQELYYYQNKKKRQQKKATILMNNKDIIFQQECDKIHSYLLHSMLKFDSEGEKFSSLDAIERRNEMNSFAKGRSYSARHTDLVAHELEQEKSAILLSSIIEEKEKDKEKSSRSSSISCSNGNESSVSSDSNSSAVLYPKIREDREWIASIAKYGNLESTSLSDLYNLMVSRMGIFRWQSLHGFNYNEYRAKSLIRPTFSNMKEEVLLNDFHRISRENWNQTLRKAKAFSQSWASRRIRASFSGQYHDQITGNFVSWVVGEEISLSEVICLKLYTDFDELQFELKKCFRWEQIGSLLTDSSSSSAEVNASDSSAASELFLRLRHFYHWRMSLQVTLRKFGSAIGVCHLYHGVNSRMILYPSAVTQSFYGPLSTTTSFHVAKTFATDGGMVLKISSMYPRLSICRAFNASLLSDYPEECEWLVGFVYTRIGKVHTKENWKIQDLPCSSQLRFAFFVIHLFKLQVFSLSSDLECLLSFFLDNYLENDNNSKLSAIWNNIDQNNENNGGVESKIMKMLKSKFAEYAQVCSRIRFDNISYGLRHHFMDEHSFDIKESIANISKNTYKYQFRISFFKIQKCYPQMEEIHLYNYYKLDDVLLLQICHFLMCNNNMHRMKQIKFLYYDYKGNITDQHNSHYYFPTKMLKKENVEQLNQIGWEFTETRQMQKGSDQEHGIRIRLKKTKL